MFLRSGNRSNSRDRSPSIVNFNAQFDQTESSPSFVNMGEQNVYGEQQCISIISENEMLIENWLHYFDKFWGKKVGK